MAQRWRTGLLTIGVVLMGCGGDEVPPQGNPSITNLVLTTTTVPIAQSATVAGSVAYRDNDGDPGEMIGELLLPDQTTAPVMAALLDAVPGQVEGTVRFEVQVKAGSPGRHTLRLKMLDLRFHGSNTLEASFNAE